MSNDKHIMSQQTHITILCIEDPGVLVTEHLRYMGVLRVLSLDHPSPIPQEISNLFQPRRASDSLVTITCREKTKDAQRTWADQQMKRLTSYGEPAVWWTDGDFKGTKIVQHTHALGILLANRRRQIHIDEELEKGNIEPLADALATNFYSSREVKQ